MDWRDVGLRDSTLFYTTIVPYIFQKYVIFDEVSTFRPATLLKSVWQRYLTEIFVMELLFNQNAGINTRPAALLKRRLYHGDFLVNALEFSAFLQKSLK